MIDAVEYLTDRVEEDRARLEHNPNHRISNGVSLMLELEDPVPYDYLIERCFHTLDRAWYHDKGETMLTAVSAKIGRQVLSLHGMEISPEPDAKYEVRKEIVAIHLALGDLIIESFYNTEYLTIRYDHERGYLVAPTIKVDPKEAPVIEDNTSTTPIAPITRMFQENKRPLIKRKRRGERLEPLDTVYIRAADKAQQQGWKVNQKVYDAVKKHEQEFIEPYTGDDEDERQRQTSRIREYWGIMNRAEKLYHEHEFYQFVEFDYRGRMYINESYFNFQGADLARGLMLFNRPKRVTENGRKWLARHTACSFNQSYDITEIPSWCTADYRTHLLAEGLDSISVDKFTMADRERWTYENMDLILSTAREGGVLECEKPISFLACCYEWEKYNENPDLFYSALPIPIDGSNNGWQHLAAISKDPQAGQLVGLVPVEIQEDFYVKTAKALIDIMPEWFEERQIPMKKIRKGISKRGSMTRAYSAGAGKIGENMWTDVKQAEMHTDYDITPKDCMLLAKNLVLAINGVCTGPLETMAYLQKLANIELDTTRDTKIEWLTPAGFCADFEARLKKKDSVQNTIRGFKRVRHRIMIDIDRPDRQKFMTGISPNFIHSLDASHMCIVMDRWHEAFGGVHDSFSTYADDVDDLQELTKEVFIEMYAHDDNFQGIADMILTHNPGITIPGSGPLNIEDVRHSDYFFA